MKKSIFAIVLLGLIYGGLWYKGAQTAKGVVEEKIDKATKFLESQGYTLTNDGVTVKGFPVNYEVKIKSPHLKKNLKSNPDNPIESVSLHGHLTLTSNLTGTTFSVEKVGDDHIQLKNSDKDGEKIQELSITGKSLFTFSVEEKSYLESIKNPFKSLFKIIEENENEFLIGKKGSLILDHVKVIDVENPGFSIFEVENANIDYSLKEINKEISGLNITGAIKGMNMDTFFLGPSAYTPGHERSLKEIALLLSIPRPGKTNMSFELNTDILFNKFLSLTSKSTLADWPPFNFDLKKLDISNDFGNFTHRLSFTLQDVKNSESKDPIKQFNFNGLATSETTTTQFEGFKDQWGEFLSNLPMCQSAKEPCPLMTGLVPKLDQFGKITAEADLKLTFPNAVDLLDNSNVLINHFDYFSKLYGLKSNGVVEFKKPEKLAATYKIDLLAYKALFSDLFNYLQRVEQVLPYINPETANMPKLKESQVKMITDYFREISDEPTKDLNDITITLKIDGSQMSVGTLSQDAFITKTENLKLNLVKSYQEQLKKTNEGGK